MDQAALLAALFTTIGTIFVAELADKDALFLLALATKTKASMVFAAGSIAFTITTAIIVLVGSLLITVVPVVAIKLAGGSIMLAYAVLEFYRFSSEERLVEKREERLLERGGKGAWSIFIPAVLTLIALDLAGDATELLTIVLVARFNDAVVVFFGAVIGLVAAVAVETVLGNRLSKVLSRRRIKYLSIAVFTVIGLTVIATTLASL
ncbi:MAG TPA: TMEM165/GDT1 family protein [Nitrososphaerales archaeon]|nr:TMEM165/GDT1 family protein [Nitrososphaerales archaeon]